MIALGCSGWPWDWDDCFKEGLQAALEWAFGTFFDFIFEAIANVVIKAVEAVMKAVGLLWVYIKTPDIAENTPALWIQEHTNFIMVFIASIAVVVAAMQMAISHRGEPARDIVRSLVTLVVVTGSATAFAGTLISASDEFSSWIVNEALAANDHNYAKNLLDVLDEPFGWLLVIFVGILMVITAIVQLALMIVRYGMLVLLVGVLPLTAAATNTEMGMMWFKRALAWLASFIIYKPVAAIIYATSFMLMGATDDGGSKILKVIMGVTLMIVAVVALPAILRFVSPRTS
ncbi:hypothetical protein [Kribbella sp. HUAS MG21]|uniref:TrbL/VirB6 plasmid conjugal transfer protein n=1 Tax=Kribbella sp. HUAS MG21 TaxID=3160966 RepID=A0AAU7TKE2_9ACTN